FWYRNDLPGGTKEFILVDAEAGNRREAFDHTKLAAALSKAAGQDYRADRLPFDSIEFVDTSRAVRFKVGGTAWECDLSSYECSRSARDTKPEEAKRDEPLAPTAGEDPWAEDPAPDPEQGEARQPPAP